jgi:hypothetical protein
MGGLESKAPALKDVLLPYVVDATREFQTHTVLLLGLVALVGVPGVWLVVQALLRSARPGRHPIAKALRRFGKPAEVAAAIERERGENEPGQLGPVELAGRWLLCRSLGKGFQVFRLDDLVWVHKAVITVNGVPNYWAKLYDRDGVHFAVRADQKKIDALLGLLVQSVPWVLAGYAPELERAWQSNPQGIVAAVEQRRMEYEQGASEPPAPEAPPPIG